MIYRFGFIEKLLLRFNVLPQPLIDTGGLITAGRALIASVKLGIIDAMGEELRPVSSIAQDAGVSEHGAEMVLDCLEAIGYVKKRDNNYKLTSTATKFLTKDSPHSVRNIVLLSEQTYNSYMELDETIKAGKPATKNLDKFSDEDWDIFTKAMIELASSNVEEVTKMIPAPSKPKKLLDIGGSHGLYSIELCKKHPSLSAEIMDLEPVKPYAEKCIADHNMQEQVHYRIGDALKDDLGDGYDIVLAFNIIHGLNTEDCKGLTQRVYQSMNQDGIFVILDQIKGIGGKSPLSRLTTSFMALNLFQQAGGRTYSYPEVKGLMEQSGFKDSKLKKMRAPGFGLVIGRK